MSAEHAAERRAAGGTLAVAVVTPEGQAFKGTARSVVVPGHDGEVAFFPLHAAFVGALGYGELRVSTTDGGLKRWYLEGGVVEVADDKLTVLAERVLAPERIDAAAAREQLAKAIASVPADEAEEALREAAIRSARARLALGKAPAATPAH